MLLRPKQLASKLYRKILPLGINRKSTTEIVFRDGIFTLRLGMHPSQKKRFSIVRDSLLGRDNAGVLGFGRTVARSSVWVRLGDLLRALQAGCDVFASRNSCDVRGGLTRSGRQPALVSTANTGGRLPGSHRVCCCRRTCCFGRVVAWKGGTSSIGTLGPASLC